MIMKTTRSLASSETQKAGFTLIDLLAVIAIVGVLGLLLVPALAGTKPNSQAFQCLQNERQLIRAWQIYNEDNAGVLVPAIQGGGAQEGTGYDLNGTLVHGWASGWLDWSTDSDNTNTALLISDKFALLASYTGRSTSTYKCPADNFMSAPQRSLQWTQRCRSYSGNIGVGEGNFELGPWNGNIYYHYTKLEQIQSPANVWVFIDEHPDSINDPGFYNPQAANLMTDVPSTLHNGAGVLSFTDGHSEVHKWQGCLTSPLALQVRAIDGDYLNGVISSTNGDPDIHFLSSHAGLVNPNISF
jgi:type II secretory pathway pseudopilin PulG